MRVPPSVVAGAGFAAGLLAALALLGTAEATPAPRPPPPSDLAGTALLAEEQNTIAVFKKASKAVVNVQNIGLRRDIFTMDVFQMPQGSGSGFVWDGSGHVVTNYHVVQDASALTVTLHDGSTHDAKLVGTDPSKDLAVLRIDAPAALLAALETTSSADLQVGQKVLAIGNPFGLDQTLTTGVISALGREIQAVNGRTITNVIQADAAINPGNSGGPLLDSQGRLIGVNTAIYSPSGASAGIGFAIPADTVLRIVPELIEHGRVVQPGLGVSLMNDAISRRFGISGVVIAQVPTGSPAAKAGLVGLQRDERGSLLVGDVVIAVNDKATTTIDQLLGLLEDHAVGDQVTITVRRGTEQRTVALALVAAGVE